MNLIQPERNMSKPSFEHQYRTRGTHTQSQDNKCFFIILAHFKCRFFASSLAHSPSQFQ